VQTGTRDRVIYYLSTRNFFKQLVCFFLVCMHFCLGALFQTNSMQKFIKIPLIPSMSNKDQKKIQMYARILDSLWVLLCLLMILMTFI